MLDFSIYLLYRAGTAIASLLPLRPLFAMGNLLGLCAWLLLPGYRRLARRNLEIAFGNEKTNNELNRIVRRNFQRLGSNLLCSVKMSSMAPGKMARYLETDNFDVVHRELQAGKPIVVVLSHIGNWELFAQLFPRYVTGTRLATVYQRLGNRYIDAHVRRQRSRTGVETFDRAEGFHGPIEVLRSGGIIGILGDQHAGDHGVWTPFFGRLASTSPLPGLLAKRTGATVISAAVHTIGLARWRMAFKDPINSSNASVNLITFNGNEVIEKQIREAPEDWFWVHNRWKTPKPRFLLNEYKRGVYIPPEWRGLKPFRILIRSSNWLGDSIISMPAVRAIKAGRPDAHITVVVPEKIAATWKLLAEVDEVISLTTRSLLDTVRTIRRQPRFDVAILFPNSLRTALEVWLARIPRRVGYSGHERRGLLNQIIPEPSKRGPIEHQVHRYLQLAGEIGASDTSPSIKTSAGRTSQNEAPVKIGLCPGAEYGPAKRWLPERFAEVAKEVAAHRTVQWILFGTTGDAANGAIIETAIGSCQNRIGQTTLTQLIAELQECALLLTNDTGTMHLATLLDVPVVAVFGSTEPRLTGPLGAGHRVIRHQVECSPCFLRECPIDFRCMKAITVAEVRDSVLALLHNSSQ